MLTEQQMKDADQIRRYAGVLNDILLQKQALGLRKLRLEEQQSANLKRTELGINTNANKAIKYWKAKSRKKIAKTEEQEKALHKRKNTVGPCIDKKGGNIHT